MRESIVNLRLTRSQAAVVRTALDRRQREVAQKRAASPAAKTRYAYEATALGDVRQSLDLLLVTHDRKDSR